MQHLENFVYCIKCCNPLRIANFEPLNPDSLKHCKALEARNIAAKYKDLLYKNLPIGHLYYHLFAESSLLILIKVKEHTKPYRKNTSNPHNCKSFTHCTVLSKVFCKILAK